VRRLTRVRMFGTISVRPERSFPTRRDWPCMRTPAGRLAPLLLLVLIALVTGCGSDQAASRDEAPPLYVAIGASESVGTGARNPATEGWVAQLHAMMPAGARLANLGIGGISLHQAIEQELPVAVDLQPSVVTVWLALNDLTNGVSLEAYQIELDTLLGTLARDTRARVFIANLPDLTSLPAFKNAPPDDLRAQVLSWNEVIAAVASVHGATLVDVHGGWNESSNRRNDYISRDGLHPSTAGHRRLAELFWQSMQERQRVPGAAGGG
jgi:acyl-CoA thioesterase I